MESDIKLQDRGTVQIEGNEIFVLAHDIKLDSPARRSGSGHRRALVHNTDDGLTINFNGDYPGGVIVKGTMAADNIEMPNIRGYFGHASITNTMAVLKREIDALKARIETLEAR